MKLDNDQLIKEFYTLYIKDTFPDLSEQRCKEICHAPWQYLKDHMESGDLPTVRFKYFGTFVVHPKRVVEMLKKLRGYYKQQKMALDRYKKKEGILLKFLENENRT